MSSPSSALPSPVRWGIIGGSPSSWIGNAHIKAASLDLRILHLCAGVFGRDATLAQQHATSLGVTSSRIYKDLDSFIFGELALPESERVQFVAVVLPNALHYSAVHSLLSAGFHVLCDKPLTLTLKEAESLVELADTKGRLLGVTHNYSGNAMVKLARQMIREGKLGNIRKIVVNYSQGWLVPLSADVKPKAGEKPTSLIDVGTHAHQLAAYMTDLTLTELLADASTFVPNSARGTDDYNVLLRYSSGARGVLIASQSSSGNTNDLKIEVYGDVASLEWHQELPEQLWFRVRSQPAQLLLRGAAYLSPIAKYFTRVPCGHPEGYLEAFANLYRCFARRVALGDKAHEWDEFPTGVDGAKSLRFVEAVEESIKKGSVWVDATYRGREVLKQ